MHLLVFVVCQVRHGFVWMTLVVCCGCIEITYSWRLWLPRRRIYVVAAPLLLYIIVLQRVCLDHETF